MKKTTYILYFTPEPYHLSSSLTPFSCLLFDQFMEVPPRVPRAFLIYIVTYISSMKALLTVIQVDKNRNTMLPSIVIVVHPCLVLRTDSARVVVGTLFYAHSARIRHFSLAFALILRSFFSFHFVHFRSASPRVVVQQKRGVV